MNLEEMKYDAFISYRHCELDQFVAVTLHKELEAFRLPKSIQKQLEAKGIEKKRIERVFRDRDELPITNNLADPITNALRNSEFLLVICSPRLSQSMWCRKEIETFISMHGREKVFAVLIEGEPDESFPEELLYEERRTVDENGTEKVERVPIEPLAADVRGKNKSEIHKKIKEEVLRLAAPMFGCSYDDLKQRHRERMLRRIITTACVVSAVFGSFGIVSTTMALRIQKQSRQIQAQSEEIQVQADQIELQYQEALKTNARQMAEDAFESMDEGDLEGAVQTAYEALTKVDGADMPYTAEAEYALSSALQTYRNGLQITPQRVLKQESQVNFTKLSPDGNTLMVVDIFGNLAVYEPLTGNLLYEAALEGYSTYLSEEAVCFAGNTKIAYPTEDGFAVYDFETKEAKECESSCNSVLQADINGNYLLAEGYDGLVVYSLENMEPLYSQDIKEGETLRNTLAFSNEFPGKMAVEYESNDRGAGIYLLDVEDQTCTTFITDLEGIMSVRYDEDKIYLCGYEDSDDLLVSNSIIYCIDLNGNKKWEYHTEGLADHIITFGESQKDKLSFEHYSTITVLNKEDGTLLAEEDLGREIVGYCAYVDLDILTVMTRDGSYYYYSPEKDMAITYTGKFVANSDNLKEFSFGNGYYVSEEHLNDSVVIYENAMGNAVNTLLDLEYSATESKISPDGTYVVSYVSELGSGIFLISDLENESMDEIEIEGYIYDFAVNENNQLVVLCRDAIEVYDLATTKQLKKSSTTTKNSRLVKNGTAYIGYEEETVFMVDVETDEIISRVEEVRIVENGLFASAVDEQGLYYAYSDEEQKKIRIGSFEDESFSVQIPANVNTIEFLAIAPQEKAVYITYLDDSVESYDITTGNMLRNYGILENGVENIIELTRNDRTILQASPNAYLLNENKEVIAFIQGFTDYCEKNDSFILNNSYNVYEVENYELADLLEEANGLLKE